MASYTLSVDVVSANGLSGSVDSLNPCVELRFAGQRFTTLVKNKVRRPVWNERFLFNALDKDKVRYGTLEAYAYSIIAGRKTFVGRVRIAGSTFADSSVVLDKGHPLRGGILPRSRGTLHLKVFLQEEPPIRTSDPLLSVIDANSLRGSGRESVEPADVAIKEITPAFIPGMIVEYMPYVFVHVVKARNLPDVDARGRLNSYVEVKVGDAGGSSYMDVEQSTEWNATFAFSKVEMDRKQLTVVYVILKNNDLVNDDFVGMVWFNVNGIPQYSSPSHKPLAPEWHRLADENGGTTQVELKLAVWRGSQADKAFPDAWKPDVRIGPKVYDSPRLWYLRVMIIELNCVSAGGGAEAVGVDVKAALGDQCQETERVEKPLGHHFMDEELMFVAAEPFEDPLRISVQAHRGPDRSKVVGQIDIPLKNITERVGSGHVKPEWFDLHMSAEAAVGGDRDEFAVSSCRIRLISCLEGGYTVRYDSADYADDLRPPATEISDPSPVGSLEIGILGAKGLHPRKRINEALTLHPYCLAKYGRKWVRTRTINNSCSPVFNEQYTWEVYDTATVLTIGVFDNGQLEGYSSDEDEGAIIGKVRIRLSNLEPDRTYAHSYPLLVLRRTGVMVMGELHLAVRFSPKSVAAMLRMYSSPSLPKMHYMNKLSVVVQENLRPHAVRIVAARFNRMDPPLWKEVVEYMCDVRSTLWSTRKTKANFSRIMSVLSFLFMAHNLLNDVCLWKNPVITFFVHILFVLLVKNPELILTTALLCTFVFIVWNYQWRPTHHPHADIRVSQADAVSPDELEEEFDTFQTSQNLDLLGKRYNRLRTLAGRIQTVLGDVASCGEKIQALTSWRDTTATAIFGISTFAAAAVMYVTPLQVVVLIAGFYIMRHPRLRRETPMPSFLGSFYRRLPERTDSLL